MASRPDSDGVQNDDGNFAKMFEEFAAGKAPDDADVGKEAEPEGNAPADEPAPEAAPAEAADDGTSGDKLPAHDAPAEQAPDPWAAVPEELRSEYQRVLKERQDFEQRAKSDANRVAALSRKIHTLQSGGQPAPKSEEPTEGQKALDEKVKKLREDFPDVADPLIEMIEAQRAELGQLRQAVTATTSEQEAARVAEQLQVLEERHPDFREIAVSQGFREWLELQPSGIQNMSASWDARETSTVLSLFKGEQASLAAQFQPKVETKPAVAATDARRAQQLEGGRDVRSKPAPAASGAPNDFEGSFAHYAAKKEAERLQNRR